MIPSSELVDTLGLVAGSIWVLAALYFQMIRPEHIDFQYTIGLFLVGASIIMGSSAIALSTRPQLVQALGLVANAVFLGLGVAVWYWFDTHDMRPETPT
ncbi:hypothetical protein [Haloarcula onubensis]|uniref:Cox cluster protein n=1 Tax=Haloarcula onubensis TaxID=2950539 RepID=A0ABU2FWV5_9EURY|nr:hypothetical protein [Halomicroarcula sp. S3CR25-11]MDS0284722.1 hypothetical protein [Halomicroarcula sp. S3CR25-11]